MQLYIKKLRNESEFKKWIKNIFLSKIISLNIVNAIEL